MSLLGKPIPALDHVPHAAGVPPGVHLNLDAYDADWVASRPWINPRVGVVHTNGASVEGRYAGLINFANSSASNTHAHYNLNAPTPSKNLATNKRAIANSTPADMERAHGVADASFWTIAIETADRGYRNGGGTDLGDFLYDHAELLARIIAYESIVHYIPIVVPEHWTGTGWATHTAPWDGVYTIYKGKSCPGTTKKQRVLYGDILPRAREIHAAWTRPMAPPVSAPVNDIQKPVFINDEDDGMKELCTIWVDAITGTKAVYLVGPGGVSHLDGKTKAKLVKAGVEVIIGVNEDVAASYARVARGL